MVRHTNTWIFNIGNENWRQCVRGPEDGAVHGEENVGKPVQATRVGAPAPVDDMEAGDLVLARNDDGVAGIWQVNNIAEIGSRQERSLWDDADYDNIIYCDPIRRELESAYDEDWNELAEYFDTSVQTVTANIQGAIHNLKPEYKEKYIAELLDRKELDEDAEARLKQEFELVSGVEYGDESSYWWMVATKRKKASKFLKDPSENSFADLVDPEHFWGTRGTNHSAYVGRVFESQTPKEVANVFNSAAKSGSIKQVLDLDGFRCPIASEILRAIEPAEFAILNARSISGMDALNCKTPADPSMASANQYDEFVDNVWNAIDETNFQDIFEAHFDEEVPDWATELEIADAVFNRHAGSESDFELPVEVAEPCAATSNTAPYYWVNQKNSREEIEGEYLQAPADDNPGHDVGKLEEGDVVFNHVKGQIIGYSEIIDTARQVTIDGEDYCRADVSLTRFDEPLSLAEVFGPLMEYKDQIKYYPLHDEGINQGYLFNLPRQVGEHLLEKADIMAFESHPVLDHYNGQESASVWRFCTNPSDWLTIIRRGAVPLERTDEDQSDWHNTAEGDIVFFHVKKEEENVAGGTSLSNYGFFGVGIVGEKSTKSERWWCDEADDVVYPYLIHFDEFYVTSEISEIDFETPVFALNDDSIISEFEPLSANLVQWSSVSDLANETMGQNRSLAAGTYTNLSTAYDEIDEFVPPMIQRLAPQLSEVVPNESLPGMLGPAQTKPDKSEELAKQLNRNGQIVLHGPPGTGKTFTAARFARWWIHEKSERPLTTQFQTVTFHPSYSYEDFMEGLTANATDESLVEYEYEDGTFKEMVQQAREAYLRAGTLEDAPRYVLLIDEINRGNLSQIFGEAITQLEMDKRLDQEEAVTVRWAHTGDLVEIPPNLFIIGTMNTADRSIALVDAALRRRFAFNSFPPDYDVFHKEYEFDDQDEIESLAASVIEYGQSAVGNEKDTYMPLLALSVQALKAINENILAASDLNKGKQIGHSYLLGIESIDDLVSAWQYDILPLLEEYYFGDFDRLRREVFEIDDTAASETVIDSSLFELDRQEVADLEATDLEKALGQFVSDHMFNSQ
ncbi:McrB family protein [Natronorubrum sp. A-ect3]|uniref:McrB family protein n=1 Tax=Natronorubrum sp. A-ect3 TaxID=3242698 RepID=UPI00359DA7D0